MNKIFKTVWNRVRRCYVAVNETVTGAAQSSGKSALLIGSAAFLISGSINATVITSSGNVSGDYSSLHFGGDLGVVNTGKTLQTENSKLWANNGIGVGEYKFFDIYEIQDLSKEWRNRSDWFYMSGAGYEILNVVDALKYDWGKDKFEKYVIPNVNLEEVKSQDLANFYTTSNINTLGDISLGYISQTNKFNIAFVADSDAVINCEGGYCTPDMQEFVYYNAKVDYETKQTQASTLTNQGGNVTASTIRFESQDNAYNQTSGTTTINTFVGGGTSNFSGGILNISNLTSDVNIATNNTSVNATQINLTTNSWSATNTSLSTGLEQVAHFQQIISKAKSLLLSENDLQKTLNASAISRVESVSGLLDRFKNNVSWSGGSFHFTGSYTQTVAETARQLIQSTYGTNVGVTFDNIVADPTPTDVSNGLSAAIANAVMLENGISQGAVFLEYKLNAVNNPTTVGGNDGPDNITTSIGFLAVNGASDTVVTGGKELVFLGEGTGSTIASGKLVADNGTLRLGTENIDIAIGGNVFDVNLLRGV